MDKLRSILFSENGGEEKNRVSCSNCENILSVGPIVYNSVFGTMCGRSECANLASTKGSNSGQVIYEKIAIYLEFPCRYRRDGCLKELKWEEVISHEEACTYKNIKCQFHMKTIQSNERCEWSGDRTQLIYHVKKNHREQEFVNPVKIEDLMVTKNPMFFASIRQNHVFLSFCITKNKILFCKIWTDCTRQEDLKYRLKFYNENQSNSIETKEQRVEILHIDAFKEQITVNCTAIDLNNLENFLDKIYFVVVKFFLNNDEVKIKRRKAPFAIRSVEGFYSRSLEKAECDHCNYELTSPSYVCLKDHRMCHDCGSDKIWCWKCATDITENRTYDKLRVLLDKLCHNHSRGCPYVGPSYSMEKHEAMCRYKTKSCYICNIAVEDMAAHVTQKHTVIFSDKTYKLSLKPNNIFEAFILFDKQVFNFLISTDAVGDLTYLVVCLDMDRLEYIYELQLIDNAVLFFKIVFSNICCPREMMVKEFDNTIKVPSVVLKQIFPFLGNIEFRLSIMKIPKSKLSIF